MSNNMEKQAVGQSGAQLKPYYDEGGITLYRGDCLEIMPALKPQSVDAVIADLPYG